MKVFVSHSSRQKLFARELIRRLPPSVEVWIDEKDIPVGSSINTAIEEALSADLLAVVLVVDYHSSTSAWVRREVEATLAAERKTGANLLL
ncbi:MAG TPA: toll/interleukin-1 receptor domain-containing protein, partial [Allosphingosinicella sp.]